MNNTERPPARSETAISALLLPAAGIITDNTADQGMMVQEDKVKTDSKQAKDGNTHGVASADAMCGNDRISGKVRGPVVEVAENWDLPVIEPLDLLEKIADKDNLYMAIRTTASEPDKSSGIDGRSVTEVCDSLLESDDGISALQEQILKGAYTPGKIRRVEIPKRGKNGTRPLGIANVIDRIVQRAVLSVLSDYVPSDSWSEHSYAYHKGCEVRDALADVDRARKEGFRYVVSVDLKAFFDNVPQERLIRKLRQHIRDVRVVELLVSFIKADVILKNGELIRNDVLGTPQGNALSPYLASDVYLDELDKELTRRKHRFVRYADDCVIFCKTVKAAVRTKRKIQTFLTAVMECPVNEDKTEIKSVDTMEYLGVCRNGNAWYPEEDRIQDLKDRVRELLTAAETFGDPGLILKAHASVKGFINYYERIRGIDRAIMLELKEWSRSLFPTDSGRIRTAPAMKRTSVHGNCTCSRST